MDDHINKRAALYVRVSSERQVKDGDSLAAQIDALRRYASKHNMIIAGEYVDEGLSGTKFAERDDLQRMLADVNAGKIDIILFTKLDRFYRSIRHYTATQAVLDKCGVGWLAIWEPVYDTTTPAGRLIVNQMMSIAQFEAENTGARIRQVQAYKVRQKEVISGSVPPGYSISNKHLIINDDSPDVVRAFNIYDRCGSLADTVRAMAGSSLPSTTSGMKRILSRRLYIGEAYGIPDFCPPIIDRALFDRVQVALSRNVKSSQKHIYLFSGLIRCAECGAVMASQTVPKHGKTKKIYRCSKHYQRQLNKCPNPKVIYEAKLERDLLDQLPDMILEQITAAASHPSVDYEKQRATISRKIDRLKTLFIAEEISLDEYRADKAALLEQLDALQPVAPPDPPEALFALAGLDIRQIYDKLTLEERRSFWRGIIREIRFDMNRAFFIDFM